MLLLPLTTLHRISPDKIPLSLWRITQRQGEVHGCHEPLWWVQVQIGNHIQSPLVCCWHRLCLDGCEASGCLFSPVKAGSLKPLVKFPLQEERVLVWIKSSFAVMAVTTTRLSTFICWMSRWDWPSHSLSQGQKTINILGMFLAISAELTWPHVRPRCTFGSRARRAAVSFQGCVKDLFCPFPVNSKNFCCLCFKKWYSLVNAKSTLKIT